MFNFYRFIKNLFDLFFHCHPKIYLLIRKNINYLKKLFIYCLTFLYSVLNLDITDLIVQKADHHSKLTFFYQFNRLHSKASTNDPVISSWSASTLYMSKNANSCFISSFFFNKISY